MGHLHNGILLGHKKKILSFVTTWIMAIAMGLVYKGVKC